MGKASRKKIERAAAPALLKLDFGCGPHKRDGFVGVDQTRFDGVDVVADLRHGPWLWADGTVAEAHASHFIEHLTPVERCLFVNELYRILVTGGTCQVIVPHWNSNRAYGDPTHQWPAVSEMWFFYLDRAWRMANAPHTDAQHWPAGFNCDFEATWGYNLNPALGVRNQEYQQFAIANYKESCLDTIAVLKKRVVT